MFKIVVFGFLFFYILPLCVCLQASGTKLTAQLAEQWDNVTDEQVNEGKGVGVKLDRKRKAWVITSDHGDQELHKFGLKHGCNPEHALREAISGAKFLEECQARVFDWTKKQCSTYTREQGINSGQARSTVASHRNLVASHMWRAGKPSTSSSSTAVGATVSTPETGVSAHTSKANGGKTHPIKKTGVTDKKEIEMFSLPSGTKAGNRQAIADVTSSLFRSGADQEPVQSLVQGKNKKENKAVEEIYSVAMPYITVVKFLEGVALVDKDKTTQVFGELLGSQIPKGKYKGCWLVGSLFMPDFTMSAEKNETERKQWLDANPGLSIIGRQGLVYMPSICRCI